MNVEIIISGILSLHNAVIIPNSKAIGIPIKIDAEASKHLFPSNERLKN